MGNESRIARQSGTTVHEIYDPEGNVIAWAVDGLWASVIVGLLNQAEADRRDGDIPNRKVQQSSSVRNRSD